MIFLFHKSGVDVCMKPQEIVNQVWPFKTIFFSEFKIFRNYFSQLLKHFRFTRQTQLEWLEMVSQTWVALCLCYTSLSLEVVKGRKTLLFVPEASCWPESWNHSAAATVLALSRCVSARVCVCVRAYVHVEKDAYKGPWVAWNAGQ